MAMLRRDQSLPRAMACFENDGLQTGFSCLALDSFFYAYSAIVDSFIFS